MSKMLRIIAGITITLMLQGCIVYTRDHPYVEHYSYYEQSRIRNNVQYRYHHHDKYGWNVCETCVQCVSCQR